MTVWYKVDHNRFMYRELWRLSGRRLWPFALAVYRKWFNVQMPATSGFAISESLELVDLQLLPDRPREVLVALISQIERNGLRFVFCLKCPELGGFDGFTAVLISADGMVLGNANWTKVHGAETASFVLGSRSGVRRLLTGNEAHGADSPPQFDIWHLPGKSIDELVAIHAKRLDRLGRDRVLLATEADIVPRILENQKRHQAFNVARGVYVRMTQEEVDRLSGIITADVVAETGNPFQAPRGDEIQTYRSHVPPPNTKRTWQRPTITGFIFAAAMAEVYSLNDGFDVMRIHLYTWLYICVAYVAWPFAVGLIGASVGLAIWLIHRAYWRLSP